MTEASISAQQLRNFVDRIERLEQDKAGIMNDIKDTYAEARALGYDVKVLRKVVARRKQKPGEFCCKEHYALYQRAKRENALHTKFAAKKLKIELLMREWWSGHVSKKHAFSEAEALGVPRRFYEQVAYSVAMGR